MPSPGELGPLAWTALAAGGLLVGFSKTAFGGLGALVAVAFALALPARASTGAVLPLLLLGDAIAVSLYRRHADRRVLLRLLPSTLVGLVLGAAFLGAVDDHALERTLGVLLLVITALLARAAWRERRRRAVPVTAPAGGPAGGPAAWAPLRRRAVAALAGGGSGFATMVANAAGPISSAYLLAMRVPKLAFLGTAAWLYALLNLAKVPFSAGLGLLDAASLRLDLLLAPSVVVGAVVGALVLRRVPQRVFEVLTLVLTAASAAAFLVL